MKTQKRKKDPKRPQPPEVRAESISPEKAVLNVSQVESLARTLCESEAMELVHVEYQREPGGRVLRVYIDKQGGVGLDDCVAVSRQLGDLLDVNLENTEAYRLEVSSPGTDRPVSRLQDYERFKGNQARIRTRIPWEGRKNFTGVLHGTTHETVLIRVNDKTIEIPFEIISRARLVNYNGDNSCL